MPRINLILPTILYIFLLPHQSFAQEWSYFGADQSGTKYSPLQQIHRENVNELEVAWIYRTGELERLSEAQSKQQSFENTPVIVDGSLIICTPVGRIIAVDPANGKERWVFDPNDYPISGSINYAKCRGVSHWLDPEVENDALCKRRILYGDWRFRVFAIDAKTGKSCPGFGNNGVVQFNSDKNAVSGEFIYTPSPPAVVDDVAIFGSMITDNLRQDAPSGKVRAINARTGELVWEFDPIPRDPDDPAASSWLNNSNSKVGHANVWSMMSVDEERGLVFLPTSSPSTDFYGGERPGENRYANSVVALRGKTGEMVWHYQTVHHDVWDYDLPAQPVLVDIPVDGHKVPALIQVTKQGLVFTLHRETGEPIFPVEERPVPQGGVDGEWLSPTQPFPTLPPPIVSLGLSPDDAWGFTFVDRYFCRKKIEALRHDGMYAPPSLQGTILMPSFTGGANWGGGAYDVVNNLFIVNTTHMAAVARLVPSKDDDSGMVMPMKDATRTTADSPISFPQHGTPYSVEHWFVLSPLGAPCTEPPWGRLTAIDMVNGSIKWQVALGSLENLLPIPLPLELGTPSGGGAIVTAGGVVFIAATLDDNFRAYDTQSGEVLWKTKLPAGGQATPMTYAVAGRQYVVIAAGGHALYQTTPGDYVIAYTVGEQE
ncbi:MAG: pyrroloquinoline quinone-dependent dehydrogenase [Gammaproteobacteria bacterium]|nr:pyrroloquinoline quinone-dependent dehydrogenase [Gammaproteobacteria bacterium]